MHYFINIFKPLTFPGLHGHQNNQLEKGSPNLIRRISLHQYHHQQGIHQQQILLDHHRLKISQPIHPFLEHQLLHRLYPFNYSEMAAQPLIFKAICPIILPSLKVIGISNNMIDSIEGLSWMYAPLLQVLDIG